jgi:hypothetical protein
MGFLDRLFGKKKSSSAATADDLARSQQMAGRETGQTVDEQAATRSRMETEMAGQREQRAAVSATAGSVCLHTTLTPRWDNVADMGDAEKVSSYTCQSCHQQFTAAEGQTLLATEAERIRQGLGDGATPDH